MVDGAAVVAREHGVDQQTSHGVAGAWRGWGGGRARVSARGRSERDRGRMIWSEGKGEC